MNFRAIICRPYGTFLSCKDKLIIDRQFIAGKKASPTQKGETQMQYNTLEIMAYLLTPEDSGSQFKSSLNLPMAWGSLKVVLWFFISLMLCFGISKLC